jgi:hypothetical protein
MTELMEHCGDQNQAGNNEDARNYSQAAAVYLHQKQEEQQDNKSQVNADLSSAESRREY